MVEKPGQLEHLSEFLQKIVDVDLAIIHHCQIDSVLVRAAVQETLERLEVSIAFTDLFQYILELIFALRKPQKVFEDATHRVGNYLLRHLSVASVAQYLPERIIVVEQVLGIKRLNRCVDVLDHAKEHAALIAQLE